MGNRDRMRVLKKGRTWHGWYHTRDGKRVQRSTWMRSNAAAEAVLAEWERAAADPDYAIASTANLSSALKLLVDDREQQAKAGRRAASTVGFYREKAGVLTRVLETDEQGEYMPLLLAQLRPWHVDQFIARPPQRVGRSAACCAHRAGRQRTDAGGRRSPCIGSHSKEVLALRSALKLARRAGLWEGDPGAICPHAFSPEYVPRKRFLRREELCRLIASQTRDYAAQVAFMVATSAEWGAVHVRHLAARCRNASAPHRPSHGPRRQQYGGSGSTGGWNPLRSRNSSRKRPAALQQMLSRQNEIRWIW
jgi:hypothetical protein